jgi:F-type H+-transporting ATPase subunit delta
MAYTSVLAQRYAEGLIRVVRETGRFEETARELHAFLGLFSEGGSLRKILLDPKYSTSTRQSLLDDLRPKLGLSEPTYSFLRLVIHKRRIERIEEMIHAFDELHRRELGIVHAEVTVAQPVDSATREKIGAIVARITGKKPELSIHEDAGLIGGIKIQMGNTILDASVKTKLERLRETLMDPSGSSRGDTN